MGNGYSPALLYSTVSFIIETSTDLDFLTVAKGVYIPHSSF
jgi:hypothetical protein